MDSLGNADGHGAGGVELVCTGRGQEIIWLCNHDSFAASYTKLLLLVSRQHTCTPVYISIVYSVVYRSVVCPIEQYIGV